MFFAVDLFPQFVGASIPSCDEGDPKEAAVRDMGCAAGVPDHPPAPPSKARANSSKWQFPKIRGTLLGGPYNKDPTI